MNMRFDEARRHQAPAQVNGFALSGKTGCNGGNPAVRNADVRQPMFGAVDTRVLQNEVHAVSQAPLFAASPR
jgi:hypothetical protein